MRTQASRSAELAARQSHGYWLAAAVAVIVGIWLRFSGLTQPALADDEYYIVRSVQNILRGGLPEYSCGGYYPRGLLFQYLSAALTLAGVPVEFAPRYLAVLSSILVLPGVFLLARRVGGPRLALPVLAWLSLSVWQIDGAQFGRMYAPFQAVFVWYAYFFLRAALDEDRPARWTLAALTVVGVLTWEGGVLLAATNLLLPFLDPRRGVPRRGDWVYLGMMAALAVSAYVFATTDFRHLDPALVYPEGFDSVVTTLTPGWREVATMIGPVQQRQWIWLAASVLPLAASALAVLRLWQGFRHRWMTVTGLSVALIAAAAHQFSASGLVIALMLSLGDLQWRDLRSKVVGAWIAAMALWLAGWLAYGLLSAGWTEGSDTSIVSRIPMLTLAYNLLAFPDFLLEIAKPWAATVPRLSTAIGLAIVSAVALAGLSPDRVKPDLRLLLFLLLLLLGGAAASDPPRHETRYVFFLYPLAIILLLGMLDRLAESVTRTHGQAGTISLLAAAALFLMTEDTGVREDTMPKWLQQAPAPLLPSTGSGHLIRQTDSRGAAIWLATHARPGQDLIVNAAPGVDFYFQGFDFAYIDWTHQRFLAYACDRGRRERWGNQRLLYTAESLRSAVVSRPSGFVVANTEQARELQQGALRDLHARVAYESPDARLQVLEIPGTSR